MAADMEKFTYGISKYNLRIPCTHYDALFSFHELQICHYLFNLKKGLIM